MIASPGPKIQHSTYKTDMTNDRGPREILSKVNTVKYKAQGIESSLGKSPAIANMSAVNTPGIRRLVIAYPGF